MPMTRNESRAEYEFVTAAVNRLHRILDADPGPATQSDAYKAYRQTVFIDRGLEGLTGADATYHLKDAASIFCTAAEILVKGGDFALIPNRKRPRSALECLAYAHGYRYVRGVQGVADAIAAARPSSLAAFQAERTAFDMEYQARASAAYITNEQGECPAAVAKVLQLMADELRQLASWLERFGRVAEGTYFLSRVEAAESLLDEFRAEQIARSRPARRRR